MKKIALLGSTGSIGKNALRVIAAHPDKFKAVSLASRSNVKLLSEQIKKFRPALAVIAEKEKYEELVKRTRGTGIRILAGREAVIEAAGSRGSDTVIMAIAGSGALMPLIKAIEGKKKIALANKESLVMAGEIVMALAKKNKVRIIPIDSEHSAIFQCLEAGNYQEVKRIYITGSGGPFNKTPKSNLKDVTIENALAHPKWKMGRKITIDSATLMNKGLEVIEAMHLFGLALNKIKVVIHPQAVVHSMVEFVDGSILAQLGVTDMRLPIQYALTYPQRAISAGKGLSFDESLNLTFNEPDMEKFPCLELAYEAAGRGGTCPCVLNAANEETVAAFLKGKMGFKEIPEIIREVLASHKPVKKPGLEDILEADKAAKARARNIIKIKGR